MVLTYVYLAMLLQEDPGAGFAWTLRHDINIEIVVMCLQFLIWMLQPT